MSTNLLMKILNEYIQEKVKEVGERKAIKYTIMNLAGVLLDISREENVSPLWLEVSDKLGDLSTEL